jgi:cell division protein FtsL
LRKVEEKKKTGGENANEGQSKKSGSASAIRGLIDGTMLTRKSFTGQLPFVFFLSFLAMMYISNRYNAEKLRRKIITYKTELSDLRAQSIFISAELMKLSRQTEVAEVVKKHGLSIKESEVPPKKIVVSKLRRD